MSLCNITGDVRFGHLDEVVLPDLFIVKVLISLSNTIVCGVIL